MLTTNYTNHSNNTDHTDHTGDTDHTGGIGDTDRTDGYKALGEHVTDFEGFDTFQCPYGVQEVTMTSDEVTALCPVTGQPDWYTVSVEYRPQTLCIESKSLKLYLQSFRNDGLFCEAFATRVAEDISEAIKPLSCKVTVVQKPRGGISITAVANKAITNTAIGTISETNMEVTENG